MNASNAQLTVDLNAVAYVSFYYLNQTGEARRKKPKQPTVRGCFFDTGYAIPKLVAYPLETMVERARRMGILDNWTPICVYHMRNNHGLKFKGDEAIKRHDSYNAHIYAK